MKPMEYIKEYNEYLNDNFWKWFGDSKVVDNNGNPLIVYHGTTADFNEFDYNKIQASRRPGFYFTQNKQLAQNYNKDGKLIYAYITIKNPLNPDETKKIDISKEYLEEIFKEIGINDDVDKVYNNSDSDIDIVSYLVKKGNIKTVLTAITNVTGKDGIIMSSGLGKSYVVFNPNQIKSATENNGNFDINKNSILENKK